MWLISAYRPNVRISDMANYKSLEAHCQDYNLYIITNLIATVVFGCPISTHVRPRRCWYAKTNY